MEIIVQLLTLEMFMISYHLLGLFKYEQSKSMKQNKYIIK